MLKLTFGHTNLVLLQYFCSKIIIYDEKMNQNNNKFLMKCPKNQKIKEFVLSEYAEETNDGKYHNSYIFRRTI